MVLTLGADNLHSLRTWVDASYAVHADMRSHTGGVISLGTGAILCKSAKQKLNTKSSTEAELVGATDFAPNTIWSKKFMEAQGYDISSNIFEQDNVSAIRLEKNGRSSAGRQSRHVDIRYFFTKIGLSKTIWMLGIVPPRPCWPIFLPNHCRDYYSENFETS
jgi:hypothetical protein